MRQLIPLAALVVSGVASARPLGSDLEVPRLSLQLLLGQSAPPVVINADQAPAAGDGFDHVRLRDGRELRGRILDQLKEGYLFHDAQSDSTFTLPFAEIVDLRRAAAPGLPQPQLAPPAPVIASPRAERRFFLEAELRDLQARLATVSLWPGIEGVAGGVIGLGVGVVILLFLGTDTLDAVFAVLAGVTGLISLAGGIVEIIGSDSRRRQLETQIATVQAQLADLPSAGLLPAVRPAALAFRF